MCARHLCAGAMLIFSVALQCCWIFPEGNPASRRPFSFVLCCFPCHKPHREAHSMIIGAMLIFSVSFHKPHRGHADLLCLAPMLRDDPRRESKRPGSIVGRCSLSSNSSTTLLRLSCAIRVLLFCCYSCYGYVFDVMLYV